MQNRKVNAIDASPLSQSYSRLDLNSAKTPKTVKINVKNEDILETARSVTNKIYDRGDETDRYCSALEKKWSYDSFSEPKYSFSIPYGNADESSLSMRRHRISDLTLREIPGLSNPSHLNPRRLALSLSKEAANPACKSDLRVTFTARLLLPEDLAETPHWSINQLLGFAFSYDNSWGLYDTHKTAKSTRSFSILNRGVHICAWGSRVGQPYYIVDIFPGSILHVKIENTQHLPPSLQKVLGFQCHNVLRILVTGVDQEDRNQAL
ncbi:Calcium-dependent secretion activator 2 [Cichlidogyrus casuarinus]|uniref:Calcium-dependent secretion activator 2 n=1 Tax=Cichlidogyrus casuarinus TaxID=1844966 RepID=A0ABD2QA39_9PLAT